MTGLAARYWDGLAARYWDELRPSTTGRYRLSIATRPDREQPDRRPQRPRRRPTAKLRTRSR
jgi:hypothetical protein